MKTKKIITILVIVFMCFCACKPKQSAKDRLDWVGYYSGTLPSAGGSGIEVTIGLYEDETYMLSYHYVGKSPDDDYTRNGRFTWDESGKIINLSVISGEIPPYYLIGYHTLTQLDMNGNKITGDLQDMYVLTKVEDQ